jgi:hypothetical protein
MRLFYSIKGIRVNLPVGSSFNIVISTGDSVVTLRPRSIRDSNCYSILFKGRLVIGPSSDPIHVTLNIIKAGQVVATGFVAVRPQDFTNKTDMQIQDFSLDGLDAVLSAGFCFQSERAPDPPAYLAFRYSTDALSTADRHSQPRRNMSLELEISRSCHVLDWPPVKHADDENSVANNSPRTPIHYRHYLRTPLSLVSSNGRPIMQLPSRPSASQVKFSPIELKISHSESPLLASVDYSAEIARYRALIHEQLVMTLEYKAQVESAIRSEREIIGARRRLLEAEISEHRRFVAEHQRYSQLSRVCRSEIAADLARILQTERAELARSSPGPPKAKRSEKTVSPDGQEADLVQLFESVRQELAIFRQKLVSAGRESIAVQESCLARVREEAAQGKRVMEDCAADTRTFRFAARPGMSDEIGRKLGEAMMVCRQVDQAIDRAAAQRGKQTELRRTIGESLVFFSSFEASVCGSSHH